jgi:hypothetical protein
MQHASLRTIDRVDSPPRTGAGAPPGLRALVTEASRALAQLDAGRLEELALCCRALAGLGAPQSLGERAELARQALDAAGEMARFGRVLEATRANLAVLHRARALRRTRLEYRVVPPCIWTEAGHGDD